ncbi:hypothetical protein HPB52_020474 [Rhipicephalus sanguineus]|uniref:Uncharacterized protein n=1 Tax=Rhipicephalus sanguineus TaxID=34632 RepID=A0A9D4PGE5_RHISA|nr:hypothetical protein HPB52_020474 [Rhipicephalus sanguineus]
MHGQVQDYPYNVCPEAYPRRIIYYVGEHLCTPYRERPEARTKCRAQDTDVTCAQNRRNRDVEDEVKITGKIEVANACPYASYAAERTYQEEGGAKRNKDRSQRSHQLTGKLPRDDSRT